MPGLLHSLVEQFELLADAHFTAYLTPLGDAELVPRSVAEGDMPEQWRDRFALQFFEVFTFQPPYPQTRRHSWCTCNPAS